MPTLILLLAIAHGQSQSFAEWRIDGAEAALTLSLERHDLLAVLPALEPARVLDRIGRELRVAPARVRSATVAFDGERVVYVARFELLGTELEIEHRHLPELSPAHLSFASIETPEGRVEHLFGPAAPVWRGRVARTPWWPLAVAAAAVLSGLAAWRRR